MKWEDEGKMVDKMVLEMEQLSQELNKTRECLQNVQQQLYIERER